MWREKMQSSNSSKRHTFTGRWPGCKIVFRKRTSGRAGLVQTCRPQRHRSGRFEPHNGPLCRSRPLEEDEDFDFEETLRDIHVELSEPHTKKAAELARRISRDFEELGV